MLRFTGCLRHKKTKEVGQMVDTAAHLTHFFSSKRQRNWRKKAPEGLCLILLDLEVGKSLFQSRTLNLEGEHPTLC